VVLKSEARIGVTIAALAGIFGCDAAPVSMLSAVSCFSGGPGTSLCGAAGESCCASPMVAAGSYDRTY